jgi:predicted MFS family arabinose efflux permease
VAEHVVSRRRVGAARLAVSVLFFVNGALLASWVPHVPGVQTRLALGPGVLGVALLTMAAGALVSMPIAGACSARIGSRRVLVVATTGLVIALPLPLLAPSLAALMLALFVFGASNGAMDVAMNAQALAVERLHGRPIFSAFHGLFSVGGIAGAAAGGLALHVGAAPLAHVLTAATILGALAAAATPAR